MVHPDGNLQPCDFPAVGEQPIFYDHIRKGGKGSTTVCSVMQGGMAESLTSGLEQVIIAQSLNGFIDGHGCPHNIFYKIKVILYQLFFLLIHDRHGITPLSWSSVSGSSYMVILQYLAALVHQTVAAVI